MTRKLNGLPIPSILEELMARPSWKEKKKSKVWLKKFRTPEFVEFLDYETAMREQGPYSMDSKKDASELAEIYLGQPNITDPPGDCDDEKCFVIGFVEQFDGTIEVDFRPGEPRLIASDYQHNGPKFFTVFQSLEEFRKFYLENEYA